MKSPLKAALLSALVPGLGKVYIGKTRIGFNAFIMNGVFAFQTYESIHKLGVKHPLSIINLLLSSFFYASNVYGSYRDAKYFKKEKLQQLNNDASNYYANEYFPVVF
jgi:TM2 domain-containing membrane protein YozV